jgi:hypothetical protein
MLLSLPTTGALCSDVDAPLPSRDAYLEVDLPLISADKVSLKSSLREKGFTPIADKLGSGRVTAFVLEATRVEFLGIPSVKEDPSSSLRQNKLRIFLIFQGISYMIHPWKWWARAAGARGLPGYFARAGSS